ncbi:MAG: 3-deoxy-D-manno-octulosonic acid transferase [Saprospiraceae bacterium]
MKNIYDFGIQIYYFGIWLTSFFNQKAELWVAGRKDIFSKIKLQITDNQPIIWFHCASLGEFEQGRPLIEKIKKTLPEYKILLTFFSPSGYEIRKNYEQADYIFYLPLDTKKNAKKFLEIVKPQMAFFVKYEFWYNYLHQLNQRKIPTYLISSIFRRDQIFFKTYGTFFKKMLFFFDHIFVQNEKSKTILLENGISHLSVTGDTRVDRVLEIQKSKKSFDKINTFKGTSEILIGGSTWPPDEDILIEWIHAQKDFRWKFIIAPHDISENHLEEIEKKLKVNTVRFSKANTFNSAAAKVMIIDNIGMLSSLYQYGKIALIGGGFGSGIHNTLEPITFGLPVIFGKKYQKFEEAINLVKTGGGFSISNYEEFEKIMEDLEKDVFYNNASTNAKKYILTNQGATREIFDFIFDKN